MKAPSDRIYKLEKLDTASNHIDWAIKLLLDFDEPAAAVTLAGAAEELVGARLGAGAASRVLSANFAALSGLTRSDVADQHLNKTRNWLKHDRPPATLETALEMDAVIMIVRALSNLAAVDRSMPSEGPRFLAWLSAGRPDLFNFAGQTPSQSSPS